MKKNKKNKQFNFYWIYLVFIIGIIVLQIVGSMGGKYNEINGDLFFKFLKAGEVDKIEIVNEKFTEVYIKKNKINSPNHQDKKLKQLGPHYTFYIHIDSFLAEIKEFEKTNTENEKLSIDYSERDTEWMGEIMGWLIPIAIMILI